MKNKTYITTSLLAMASLLMAYCGQHYGWGLSAFTRSQTNDPDSVSKTEKTPTNGDDPDKTYFNVTNSFSQPNAAGNFPLDLYFVIDTSGSMTGEFAALKSSVTNFISSLESQGVIDYCVALMYGHLGNKTGKIQGASSGQECLCSSSLSNSQIVTKFGQNLQNVIDNYNKSGFKDNVLSDGGECMVYSAYQSFSSSSNTAYNMAKGCMRANAAQAFVMMSDENDCGGALNDSNNATQVQSYGYSYTTANGNCDGEYKFNATYNSGSDSPRDPDCQEQRARKNYYTDGVINGSGQYTQTLTPQVFVDGLKNFNNALPVYVSNIGYVPGSSFPSGGENGPLYLGIEIAELMGNSTVTDLKDASNGNQQAFNSSLSSLASSVAQNVSLVTTFHLSEAVCSGYESQISVKIDGTATTAFTYNASAKKVVLNSSNGLDYGDQVVISFVTCE